MKCWGITDKGAVRSENQDAYIIETISENDKETVICVVCDGMGGAKAGNIASSIAAESFVRAMKESSGESRTELVTKAVLYANEQVYNKAREGAEYSGMGTTLVAAVADEDGAVIVNVGDSRCYLIKPDGIAQITKDHSLVEDMIDRGEILREEAWRHPNKNLITRVVGTELSIRCDIYEVKLGENEHLLLCTDGLSNIVNPQEMLFETNYGGNLESAAARMMNIALSRHASDNVTIAILSR